MGEKVSDVTFTAGEVHELTGIEPEKLRLWRQRGHVQTKGQSGWTRYNYPDVVALGCLAELTKAGISISHAVDIVNNSEVRRHTMIERDFESAGIYSEDRLVVVAPVTIEGVGQSYDYVVCGLGELPRVFINVEGGYLPGASCLIVLNVSDVRRRIDRKFTDM
jgi:hypothetical protein